MLVLWLSISCILIVRLLICYVGMFSIQYVCIVVIDSMSVNYTISFPGAKKDGNLNKAVNCVKGECRNCNSRFV